MRFQVSEVANTSTLSLLIERPTEVKLWGKTNIITPRICSEMFGNGEHLIWLSATNFRPHYFVVRVDSCWHIDCGGYPDKHADSECTAANCLRENLDDITIAIDDEHAEEIYAMYGKPLDDEGLDDGEYPTLFDCGSSWGHENWPGTDSPYFHPKCATM